MGIYLHLNNITIVQSLQCVLSCIVNFVFFVLTCKQDLNNIALKKRNFTVMTTADKTLNTTSCWFPVHYSI